MRELNEICSKEFRDAFAGFSETIRSERTLEEYVSITNMLVTALATDFLDIDAAGAESYFDKLKQDVSAGRLSRRTYSVRVSCLKTIAKWMIENGYMSDNPFQLIRRYDVDDSIKEGSIPSVAEIDQIIESAKAEPMWYLILCLALRACLTATQITKIRRQNISMEEDGRVMIYFPRTSSQQKELWVTIPEDMKGIFLAYLNTTQSDDAGHIFFNEWHRPLSIRNIDFGVKRFMDASGLDNHYSIKDLRSRGVLEMASAGVDPEVIGEYTGLTQLRVRSFIAKKHLISRECPADRAVVQLKNLTLVEEPAAV